MLLFVTSRPTPTLRPPLAAMLGVVSSWDRRSVTLSSTKQQVLGSGVKTSLVLIAGNDSACEIAANRYAALADGGHINRFRFALLQPTAYFFRQRLILGEQLLELHSQHCLQVSVFGCLRNLLRGHECGWVGFHFWLQFGPE